MGEHYNSDAAAAADPFGNESWNEFLENYTPNDRTEMTALSVDDLKQKVHELLNVARTNGSTLRLVLGFDMRVTGDSRNTGLRRATRTATRKFGMYNVQHEGAFAAHVVSRNPDDSAIGYISGVITNTAFNSIATNEELHDTLRTIQGRLQCACATDSYTVGFEYLSAVQPVNGQLRTVTEMYRVAP